MQYQPPPGPDNYIPNWATARYRGVAPANRRRVWSHWSVTIAANIKAEDNEDEIRIADLLYAAGRRVFSNSNLITRFMLPVNITSNKEQFDRAKELAQRGLVVAPNQRSLIHRTANFADNGDRFDARHVFAHYYEMTVENDGKQKRPHIMIDYYVLHDSAFRMDCNTTGNNYSLPYVFSAMFNATVREWGYDEETTDRYLRHIIPGVKPGVHAHVSFAETMYVGAEYRKKTVPGEHGTWTRRPRGMNAFAGGATEDGAALMPQPPQQADRPQRR